MIRFECDYTTGAHPKILEALVNSNSEATPGYGVDIHCEHARAMLRELCQAPDAGVHFLVGGTQANTTIIAAALRPHQGALCAETGHINTHESGAIESTGHKVLALPAESGKITAGQIDQYCQDHYDNVAWEHMVQPGMVYLSHPTELGTVYTLAELEAIHEVCVRWRLPLFVDGARLACGLAASDITLPDLARLCDTFYLGGTKAGLLFGEAVVIPNPNLNHDFRYLIKQHGGMLAKGRLLGVQFEAFLTDGLFLEIGRKEVAQALRIRDAFQAEGCPLFVDSATNQQFPVLTNGAVSVLKSKYSFEVWEKVDQARTAVRFCTSWSTTDADVDALIEDIRGLP
ncbi:MAG: low specificity L-threonine aldolase [Lawsonibacter sp.]|nr:low specificity L-threonine aldolase [Lawsonibacter sp.]